VLIVFSTLGVDTPLFALVLGESILNDAVALVLYDTMVQFQYEEPTGATFILAILKFCGIFLASIAIGFSLGVLASLFYKHMKFYRNPEVRRIEGGLMIVIPYLAYFLAQAPGFSGITSVSFCGIAMSEWATSSFSRQVKEFVEEAYGAVAQTFEAFTFIFMGIAFVGIDDTAAPVIMYALVAFTAIIIARIIHVLISVFVGNLFKPRRKQFNWKGTFLLSVVGLRGPMAFFVSIQASTQLVDADAGRMIKSVTIILICITTPLIGFLTPFIVKWLSLKELGSASSGGWTCPRRADFHRDNDLAEDLVEDEAVRPTRRPTLVIRNNIFTRFNDAYLKPALGTTADEVAREVAAIPKDGTHQPPEQAIADPLMEIPEAEESSATVKKRDTYVTDETKSEETLRSSNNA